MNRAIWDVNQSSVEPSRLAIRSHLTSDDPIVRFIAASKLFESGDDSGYGVLVDLLSMEHPLPYHELDIRIWAIRMLQQYRRYEAIGEIQNFFDKTKNIDALSAILHLARDSAQVDPRFSYPDASVPPATTVSNLTLKDKKSAAELAKVVFDDPQCPSIWHERSRQICAWAVLREGREEPYFSYLRDQSERAIRADEDEIQGKQDWKRGFQYYASVQDSEVVEMLVSALDSSDPRIVEIASVNLIYNHHRLELVRPSIVRQLKSGDFDTEMNFLLRLAAAQDDPLIDEAGKIFDQRNSAKLWSRWAELRDGFSIYQWVDGYVAILNKKSEQDD